MIVSQMICRAVKLKLVDTIQIPVKYKEEELVFNASVKAYGYVHKIEVDVDGQTVVFEQDEEGMYRGVISYEEAGSAPNQHRTT